MALERWTAYYMNAQKMRKSWLVRAKKVHGHTFFVVVRVFIDGMLRMPFRDGNDPVPPPFFL